MPETLPLAAVLEGLDRALLDLAQAAAHLPGHTSRAEAPYLAALRSTARARADVTGLVTALTDLAADPSTGHR